MAEVRRPKSTSFQVGVSSFGRIKVHWHCQCSVWIEERALHIEDHALLDPIPKDILSRFPALSSLFKMIGEYHKMSFSYREDALSAISGILSVLGRSFNGGFLFGLPEMYFDQRLLWEPSWGHECVTRRVASSRSVWRWRKLWMSVWPRFPVAPTMRTNMLASCLV